MKFERLKKDSRKKWLIGFCIILVIVATVMFVGTKAKYKNTESIDLVDGTINWIPNDLNIVAVELQNESGTYDNSDTVPTSGYTLSDKSYCEVNGAKDTSISMEYKDGKVSIGVTTKGTKCYLFFDKELNAGETILEGKTIDTSRANGITGVLTENTTGKIFKAVDDDGDTYFFAGEVDNNWIQFGGFYWRIIRINGDGTIRMIYSGAANGNVSDANKVGATTQINETNYFYATSVGNSTDNAYVGYMYGQVGAGSYANTHKNTISSYAKQKADNWYSTNLNKIGTKEHIDTNAGFCGDRKIYTGVSFSGHGTLGYGNNATTYEPASRFMSWSMGLGSWNTTINPTFKCIQSNDLYTVSGASKGNKALTYPVGLISVDEAGYAGGFGGKNNTSYYLYTGQDYWTMSPHSSATNGSVQVFVLRSDGDLDYWYLGNAYGVRPVINLKAETKLAGEGTETNPYKVV